MSMRPELDFEEKFRARHARECFFGLSEIALPMILGSTFLGASTAGGIGGLLGAGATSLLGGLGVGAGTAGTLGAGLGTIGADALGGAALGAGSSAVTGGNVAKGAEFGALGGAVTGGLSSAIGSFGGAGTAGSSAASAPAAVSAPGAAAGGGGAAAITPAGSFAPAAIAADPTVPSLSATDVASQLNLGAGVSGGGINLPSSMTGATGFYGGNATAATTPATGPATVDTQGNVIAPPDTGPVTVDAEGNAIPTPFTGSTNPLLAGTQPATAQSINAQNIADAQTINPTQSAQAFDPTFNPAAPAQAGTPGGTTTAAAQPNSLKQFWNNPSWSNAGNVVASNPGAVANALLLGYEQTKGNNVKGLNALKTEAAAQQQQSKALENYLNTNTLPQGLQANINKMKQDTQQQIRSKYASMGMSGSSAEASDLAYANANAEAQAGQYQIDLLRAGIQEAGMSAQDLNNIVSINQKQAADTANMWQQFFSAMGGGTPVKLNTGT